MWEPKKVVITIMTTIATTTTTSHHQLTTIVTMTIIITTTTTITPCPLSPPLPCVGGETKTEKGRALGIACIQEAKGKEEAAHAES